MRVLAVALLSLLVAFCGGQWFPFVRVAWSPLFFVIWGQLGGFWGCSQVSGCAVVLSSVMLSSLTVCR